MEPEVDYNPFVAPENVCIRRYVKNTDALGRLYWSYEIQVTADGCAYVLCRRFSQFEILHEALSKIYTDVESLTFPPKVAMRDVTIEVVEYRRSMLELYIRSVLNTPGAQSCKEIQRFLDPKNVGYIPPPIIEGYMSKEGHFIKNWKRRWFALRPGILQYFETEHDSSPKGTIPLNQAAICATRNPALPNTIEITTERNVLYLIRADNEKEFHRWMKAIREQSMVPQGTLDDHFSDDRSEKSTVLSYNTSQKPAPYEVARREMQIDEREKALEAREQLLSQRIQSFHQEIQKQQAAEHEIMQLKKRMCDGELLMKYKNGKPKRRFLWLADNHFHLCWTENDKKEKPKHCILVFDIKGVIVGSSHFHHISKSTQLEIDSLSFTILHDEVTLDVQCQTQVSRDLWVKSLKAITRAENPLRSHLQP